MKKLLLIALCFMALIKANSQVVDTTVKGCIAAPLKTSYVIVGNDFKKDACTHFAFIQDVSTFDKWTVTVSLRSKSENYILKDLLFTRKDFDAWDGNNSSLLRLLLTKFNSQFGLQLAF